MPSKNTVKRPYLLPIMLIVGVVVILAMLRLGVWQLDRAQQKQTLLDQVQQRADSEAKPLTQLHAGTALSGWQTEFRFQPVKMTGQYHAHSTILIENQVLNKQVGYLVITPFEVQGLEQWVMVARGWVNAGATREERPNVSTPEGNVTIEGRLNAPPAQPPLWNSDYAVNQGEVWQYLPIDLYAKQIQQPVLPLMVELAPENAGTQGLHTYWQAINDQGVAKHNGYAFQWFAMALAFFVACLVLLIKKKRL